MLTHLGHFFCPRVYFGKIFDITKFRNEGDGIYAFKPQPDRFLSFFTMETEHISVRTLAKRAGVSPTIIQKIRSRNAERINFRTFRNVLHTLGYKINLEKI